MEPSSPSHAAEGAARFLPFKKDRGKFECQLLGPPSLSSWHLLTSCFDNRYDSIGFSEPAQQTLILHACAIGRSSKCFQSSPNSDVCLLR